MGSASQGALKKQRYRERGKRLDVPSERCPVYGAMRQESLRLTPQSSWPAFEEWARKFGPFGFLVR